MMNLKYLSILCLVIFSACEEGKNIDKGSVKTAIEDRKIHRLTEADVMEITAALGEKITSVLNGKSEAEDSLKFSEKLSDLHINVTFYIPFSKKYEGFTETEQQLIEAYEYNIENGITDKFNIQSLNSLEVIYSSVVNKGKKGSQVVFIKFEKPFLKKAKSELLN